MADDAQAYIDQNFPTAGDLKRSPETVIDYRDFVKAKDQAPPPPQPPVEKPKEESYPRNPQDFTPPPPVPPPPLQDMPRPEQYGIGPNQHQESPFKVFAQPMVLLAGLSSLLARRPLVAAMGFATGAMNGFQKGQNEVFEQNKAKFNEALKQAVDQNNVEIQRNKAAWDYQEQLDNEKFAKLYTSLAAGDDKFAMALAQSHKIPELIKYMQGKETQTNHLMQAIQLAEIRDQMAERRMKESAALRYGGDREAMVQSNVEGIEDGTLPPTTTGLYGLAPAVKAGLAKDKFDLTKATLEYDIARKQILSLNGPQMTRYVGLAKGVTSTIDRVNELAEQMNLSGIPALNKAELQAFIQAQGNSPNGQLAAAYMAEVNTLKEEFANLANGGYAPTEPAWKLADQQVNGNYGVYELKSSLKEVKRAINYRLYNIPGMQQSGPMSPNRYMQQGPRTLEEAPKNPAERVKDAVYNTPKGPLRWTGTGWIEP